MNRFTLVPAVLLIAIAVTVLVTVLAALDFSILNSEEEQMSPPADRFVWSPCGPERLERVLAASGQHPDYSQMERDRLDLTFEPQHEDLRLFESKFVIKSSNMGGGNAPPLYYGPFRRRLIIEGVPYTLGETFAYVDFWAFHSETGTCSSWSSKSSSELFGVGPLAVELYDAFNRQADAWYRIFPDAER